MESSSDELQGLTRMTEAANGKLGMLSVLLYQPVPGEVLVFKRTQWYPVDKPKCCHRQAGILRTQKIQRRGPERPWAVMFISPLSTSPGYQSCQQLLPCSRNCAVSSVKAAPQGPLGSEMREGKQCRSTERSQLWDSGLALHTEVLGAVAATYCQLGLRSMTDC